MPPEINTEFDELAPLFSADGNKLFFSRRNHPRNFGQRNAEDIWISYRKADGSWSRAVNAGAPLSGRGNNRLVGLNPNETHYYFQADALADTVSGVSGLFLSRREVRSLGPPEPVVIAGFNNLESKADFHLGPEEEIMIMSVRMDDSYGVRDLYLSQRQPDGTWGLPRNLGPVVNSAVDEGSPFLAADRRSLYFCRQVAGSLTFYVSRCSDDAWVGWTTPERIPLPDLRGAPGPDFALTADGDAIIVPLIDNSGQFDLYRLPLPPAFRPEPVVLVKGKVDLPAARITSPPALVYYRRDDPGAVPERMPLRSDQGFSLLTRYGHPLVLFAEAAPFFCPAKCLNLGGQPCQIPDREQGRLVEELLKMPEYVEREQVILDLFQRRQKAFEHLNDLDIQLHTFDALSQTELPVSMLDSVLENNPVLQELATAYQANFRESSLAIKGLEEEGRPEMDEQDRRFLMLRRRFREHLQSQRDTLEEVPSTRVAPQGRPESFPAFCRQLWNRYNQQLTPGFRSRLEKEALDREIETQRDNRNSPTGLVAFLEQHRQNAAAELTGTVAADDIRYSEGWLEELHEKAAPILREVLSGAISSRLRPQVATHMERLIQEFRRNREYTTIDQEFRSRMEQQMEQEKDLIDRLRNSSPPPQAEKAPAELPPPPGLKVSEQQLTLIAPEASDVFLLPAVTFEPNTATLQPAAMQELDRLASFLGQAPELSVRIMAHTHGYLTHQRARQLTTARARKVAEYLNSRGVNNGRLLTEGMGKMDPLDSNATEEGRIRNQRLEIRLVYPQP